MTTELPANWWLLVVAILAVVALSRRFGRSFWSVVFWGGIGVLAALMVYVWKNGLTWRVEINEFWWTLIALLLATVAWYAMARWITRSGPR